MKKCYKRWDTGFSWHPREQGQIDDVGASLLSSQRQVHHSAVSRESDGYCLLWCLQSPFGWFHNPWSKNKCSCLPISSKEILGGCTAKQTRILNTVLLLLRDNGRSHSTEATTNFLKFCGWKNSSTSIQIWFPLLDFHLLPKMKHHTRGQCFHSNGYVQHEVKKWLQAQDTFLLWRTRQTDI
jgi:hypothetical protein